MSGSATNSHLNNCQNYARQPSKIEAANHLLAEFLGPIITVNGTPAIPNGVTTNRGTVTFRAGIANPDPVLQNSLNLFRQVTCYIPAIFLPTGTEATNWILAAIADDGQGLLNLLDIPAPFGVYEAVGIPFPGPGNIPQPNTTCQNLQVNEELLGRCFQIFYAPLINTQNQVLVVLATAKEFKCDNSVNYTPGGPFNRSYPDPCRRTGRLYQAYIEDGCDSGNKCDCGSGSCGGGGGCGGGGSCGGGGGVGMSGCGGGGGGGGGWGGWGGGWGNSWNGY